MDELAALTSLATADFKVPPVTDVFRDAEFHALEERVAAAEQAVEDARYDDVVELLGGGAIAPVQYPDLALRALLAGSWAQMYRGELDEALALLRTAKDVAHRPGFNDVDRADVLHRIGCVRVRRGSIARAVSDFSLALQLCDRSNRPCDNLRAAILEWRSRCFERQRNFDGARADVERALELAVDAAGDVESGYAVSSLAQVYLQAGNSELAEQQARTALELLGGREDVRDEIGNAQLVLGRALLAQERPNEAEEAFVAAEAAFSGRESVSLLAAAWMARADLATARGDFGAAGVLYRQAAQALQNSQ